MLQAANPKVYYLIGFFNLFLDEPQNIDDSMHLVWTNFDNPPQPLPPGVVYHQGMEIEIVSDEICDPLEVQCMRRELSGHVQIVFYPKVCKETYLKMVIELEKLGYKKS